jgi:hypothetical protein
MKTASAALALLFAATGFGNAQTALKQEPMMMNRGTVVLVDDGNGNEIRGLPPRSRTCVPRQAGLR